MLYINIVLPLIHERKDEIENTEKNAIIYINKQLNKLELIKEKVDYFKAYQPIIFKVLGELEDHLKTLLEEESINKIKNTNIKISGRTFFDLKKEVKRRHLKKLYEVTVILNIVDDDLVTEEEFLNVFMLPTLPANNCKIIFNKNNRLSVYYLNIIASFFNDLKPSTISRSQSFLKKGGEALNDNQINNINSFLRKNDVSKYDYIKEDIEKILPK
ncbi:hypothetical protein N8258_01500 [Algibacter sp.]|nr:hypothetical protein [Algibacter sp.]